MFDAAILIIGDEILNTDKMDTNSIFITKTLQDIGIRVRRKIVVRDDEHEIIEGLAGAEKSVQMVFITGGLGPTEDDVTRKVLGKYFGLREKKIHPEILAHITQLFVQKNLPLLEKNKKQAELFVGAHVFFNKEGTAPGMGFEKDGVLFVSMPGVPVEMKTIFQEEVLPFLRKRFGAAKITHRYVLTEGIGEAFIAEKIKDWECNLPATVKLAYLPEASFVQMRLTATASDAVPLLDRYHKELKELLKIHIVATENIDFLRSIKNYCLNTRTTIATAESCTGGYLAHLLTNESGASNYYRGSVIAYQNSVKENVLAVNSNTITDFSSVSEAVAKAMLKGLFVKIPADWGIAITGYVSPTDAEKNENNFAGIVFIAVGSQKGMAVHKLIVRTYDRMENIRQVAHFAWYALYQIIHKNLKKIAL